MCVFRAWSCAHVCVVWACNSYGYQLGCSLMSSTKGFFEQSGVPQHIRWNWNIATWQMTYMAAPILLNEQELLSGEAWVQTSETLLYCFGKYCQTCYMMVKRWLARSVLINFRFGLGKDSALQAFSQTLGSNKCLEKTFLSVSQKFRSSNSYFVGVFWLGPFRAMSHLMPDFCSSWQNKVGMEARQEGVGID